MLILLVLVLDIYAQWLGSGYGTYQTPEYPIAFSQLPYVFSTGLVSYKGIEGMGADIQCPTNISLSGFTVGGNSILNWCGVKSSYIIIGI